MTRPARSTVAFGLSLCLGAGVIALLVFKAGPSRLLQVLSHISWWYTVPALACYGAAWFFRTWRLARFIKPQTPSASYLFRIQVAGFALNAILPMKLGDALTVLGLNAAGMTVGRATAIVVQTRILDLFVLLTATSPLVFTTMFTDLPRWIEQALFLLGLSACLPPIFTAIMCSPRVLGFLEARIQTLRRARIRIVAQTLLDAAKSYRDILFHGRLFLESAGLTCLIWLLEAGTTASVAWAVGTPVPFFLLLPALAVANLSKAAPTTPGGVGVYEALMAMMLASGGIPFEHALAIAMCDHLLKKAVTLGLGIPCVPALLGPNWKKVISSLKFKEAA
jgi:hypothetical protein